MTKSKNKRLYIILFACLFSICALFMPFIFSKNKNRVFADTTTSWTSPNLNLFVTYWSNQTSPSTGTAINIFFSPLVTRSNGTTSLSFYNKYINVSNTSDPYGERNYVFATLGSQTAINSLNFPTDFYSYPTFGIDRTPAVSYHFMNSATSGAYSGAYVDIWCERTNTNTINGAPQELYDYFDPSLMDRVEVTYFVYQGAISSINGVDTTRRVKVQYFDRHGVSIVFRFLLSDYYVFYDYYSDAQPLTLYVSGTKLLTSEAQLQDSYNSGYTSGYTEGESNGYDVGYSAGNTTGYSNGYSAGDSAGYTRGLQDANQYTFMGLIGATIDAPIKALTGLLNFNILGINLSAFVYGLFSITLVIIVIKYIKGSK